MAAIRVHGRGGQGVVTAAELLSVAAFLDGRESMAVPSFGSERMGAPVVSYCRISEAPIRVREPILDPDAILVLDATLLHAADVFDGLRADGVAVLNSARSVEELHLLPEDAAHAVTVAAADIARTYIGTPQVNVCLLGALAQLTGCVSMGALETAVRRRFGGPVAEANLQALDAAADAVRAVGHV